MEWCWVPEILFFRVLAFRGFGLRPKMCRSTADAETTCREREKLQSATQGILNEQTSRLRSHIGLFTVDTFCRRGTKIKVSSLVSSLINWMCLTFFPMVGKKHDYAINATTFLLRPFSVPRSGLGNRTRLLRGFFKLDSFKNVSVREKCPQSKLTYIFLEHLETIRT